MYAPLGQVAAPRNHVTLEPHANAMIRSGNSTRFTPLRQVGLDMADVKRQSDIDTEVTRWAYTLAHERFELLEHIAVEMAKAKGLKLPPKLSVAK
jgi:hypothetical protein